MKKPLSVYLHVPFCEARCSYCDFYSNVSGEKEVNEYVDRLCAEIKAFNKRDYIVKTIFIGGGTPSVLTPAQITRIFKSLKEFEWADGAEVSIESNPNSLAREKLETYLALGVNRLSIGVQSFDDKTLKILGRLHSAEAAVSAIKLAREVGFKNINIDLIYGVPEGEVNLPSEILGELTHISLYNLIEEEGTRLTENKDLTRKTEDEVIAEQTQLESVLNRAGFSKYEVANFAREGFECSHNLVYWLGGDYIGFGSSAHSLVNNKRFSNSNQLIYRKGSEYNRTEFDIFRERVMLGLRTRYGISGEFAEKVRAESGKELAELISNGFLKDDGENIITTEKGLQILNQIILKIL
ncbi:MAG: radical SAM family heme chaperone HemW [Christensenellaceae bacterium]|jgi:oxygen-independent coproporphyrinogen-3 oxidase|nr:radical SAM family heme chaperone HemW [Christensenellaceae bacterium]